MIFICTPLMIRLDFPRGSAGKESAHNAGDLGSVPGLGRAPGREHGNPLQYSCLENPHGQRSLSSVQSLSHVPLFASPWTAACQASLTVTNSRSLLRLMSIKSVMPSNHLILCHPHLLLPSIFPSIKVFSNESAVHIRWSNYWSFSFSISP